MLELDCLYNNTSFWLSLSIYEITYYLFTLSKRVSPLITLSFNQPKPTKGLDALSQALLTLLPWLEFLGGAEGAPWTWPWCVAHGHRRCKENQNLKGAHFVSYA